MVNISFFGLRVVKEDGGRYDVSKKIQSPEDVHKILKEVIKANEHPEENLWLLTLNTKNVITGIFTVSTGTLSTSLVHPREVFKRALIQNAASIIICHNHPSGDPTPSREDVEITKRLHEAGELLGIKLLDHVIIGDHYYISLKAQGYF